MCIHDYLRKRQKGENVTNQKKYPGTPNYHIASARKGQQAKPSVPRPMRTPAEIARENQMRAFKLGAMLGFAVAALVFALILWLWVIPTMDGAVQQARQAVSYVAVAA